LCLTSQCRISRPIIGIYPNPTPRHSEKGIADVPGERHRNR
jgi:hypothetical protein